jgi:hypothetical protein
VNPRIIESGTVPACHTGRVLGEDAGRNHPEGCHEAAFLRQLLAKRGLTVATWAEYAGGFAGQFNLLWRKEFRFGRILAARVRQCGSGEVASPQVRLSSLTRADRQAGKPDLREADFVRLKNLTTTIRTI